MNKVILRGNLTRDPEIREVPIGDKTSKVANFSVAVSRWYKKANGETEKTTEFIDCEAWDTGAQTIEKIMSKGDPILLEGSIKTDKWEKDGKKFSKTKVRVTSFDKLARFVKDESKQEEVEEAVSSEENGEDIPF